MKRDTRTYSIREVLNEWLSKNRKVGYRIKEARSIALWETIPDEYVKSHSSAKVIKEGILTVHTDSPVLANELSLRERELRDLLNGKLGEQLVKKIVFKPGYVHTDTDEKNRDAKTVRKIGIDTLKKVDDTVESVNQEEIREVLRRLFISSAERGRRTKE